jgi:sialate O-acetylesterase
MIIKLFFTSILLTLSAVSAFGDVRLPDVIGNSMVLQQKQTVPIWGFAESGETVTVAFAGQKKTTVAGADG